MTEVQKEQARARTRAWYAANRERALEYEKQRRAKNLPEAKAVRKSRYAKDPEAAKAAVRAWKVANPRKVLAQTIRRYGLTLDDYDRLWARQVGRCAVCRREPGAKKLDRLHVDHDHASGRVRGLLCGRCNVGLGAFGDDAERMRAAALYVLDPSGLRFEEMLGTGLEV